MSVRVAATIQAGYAGAAALLLLFAGIAPPPPRVAVPAAGAAGLGAGLVLCLLLAVNTERPPQRLTVPAVAAGVTEEVVWRWGVLAGSAPLLGWGGALALSTVAFAYRHTRSEGLIAYLVLGACFGGVFLATGRLIAAVAAHSGYNAAVLLTGHR